VSKEQLLAANQESEIIPIFRDVSLSAGRIPGTKRIEPGSKSNHGRTLIAIFTLEKCEMQARYAVGEKCELVYK
jgi:hypothetical protein